MYGPYLNSLIPIVGAVAASAWTPMSSVTTPAATIPRLYHAITFVSFFMVLFLPPHTSERSISGAVPPGSERVGGNGLGCGALPFVCLWTAARPEPAFGERVGRIGHLDV